MKNFLRSFVILFICLCYIFNISKPEIFKSAAAYPDLKISTWLWGNPIILSDDQINQHINFSINNNIGLIALDMNQYLDMKNKSIIYNDPSILVLYEAKIIKFLTLAHHNNIKVEALIANDKTLSSTKNKIFEIFKYIKTFDNKTENFDGLHLDIEYYNTNEFYANPNKANQSFLYLTDNLLTQIIQYKTETNKSFNVSFDFSAFFDGTSTFKNVKYNGLYLPVTFHLANILNKTENSYIYLMSYRNFALGTNSSTYLSKLELETISKNYQNVKVKIGQESAEIKDSSTVSFFNKSISEMEKELSLVIQYCTIYNSFDGIAIHSLTSYESKINLR